MTLADTLGIEPPTADLDTAGAQRRSRCSGACMARQGLRWEPIAEAPPAVPDAELGPVAWAERWGFGVSTMVGRSQPSAAVDPNLSRLETAGALERDAYRRALHGDGRGRGCMAVATSAVYELRDRLLRPLAEDLAALQARILADPDSIRIDAAWRRCVAAVASGLVLDRRTLPTALFQRYAARVEGLDDGSAVASGHCRRTSVRPQRPWHGASSPMQRSVHG